VAADSLQDADTLVEQLRIEASRCAVRKASGGTCSTDGTPTTEPEPTTSTPSTTSAATTSTTS
jgi:protein phosphatase